MRKEEDKQFQLVNGIYIDGKKDATVTEINRIHYENTILEEHDVVIGEPGKFYLSHVEPENGSGKSVASAIYEAIRETSLCEKRAVVGSDGIACMTGANRGAIRCMEEMIGRLLQWAICLLHCNELSLRHIFLELDGSTVGPTAFSGPVGKKLAGPVSDWEVVEFQRIPNTAFPELPFVGR